MSKMIQIRNVPDDVHRALKIRAASEGTSLSEYLLAEVEQVVSRPTLNEVLQRISKRESISFGGSAVDLIREHRESA